VYKRQVYGFVIPESGSTIAADCFVIPMGSPHKTNAEKLINFYYDPANAAELANYVNYITPVAGAREIALAKYPEAANNELIFPTDKTLKNTQAFRSLTGQEELDFATAFQAVKLGG
jgi:spermidine/putrescine transport system substrate-binding protein